MVCSDQIIKYNISTKYNGYKYHPTKYIITKMSKSRYKYHPPKYIITKMSFLGVANKGSKIWAETTALLRAAVYSP